MSRKRLPTPATANPAHPGNIGTTHAGYAGVRHQADEQDRKRRLRDAGITPARLEANRAEHKRRVKAGAKIPPPQPPAPKPRPYQATRRGKHLHRTGAKKHARAAGRATRPKEIDVTRDPLQADWTQPAPD